MATKRPSFTKDLIAQLSTNLGSAIKPETPADDKPAPLPVVPVEAPKKTGPQKGQGDEVKHVAFWLDDEDRAIFHEISIHLFAQGIKPTNNLIMRAALRLMPEGTPFLEKVSELIRLDGRTIRHKQKAAT